MSFPITPCAQFHDSKIATRERIQYRVLFNNMADEVDEDIDLPEQLANYLLSNRPDGTPCGGTLLGESISQRDEHSYHIILNRNPHQINVGDSFGCTPLFIAAERNGIHFARSLLSLGANPNIATVKPIQRFKYITPEIAEAMGVIAQIPVNATPLWIAAKKSDREMYKLLLDAGAKIAPELEPEIWRSIKQWYLPLTIEIADVTGLPIDVTNMAAEMEGPIAKRNVCIRFSEWLCNWCSFNTRKAKKL